MFKYDRSSNRCPVLRWHLRAYNNKIVVNMFAVNRKQKKGIKLSLKVFITKAYQGNTKILGTTEKV